nr:unnamed protein product [Callosobruchus chinensis]
MYKTIATLAVAIFAVIQISNAAVPGAVDLRSLLTLGDPSYEIRAGNCSNATMATMVFQDHVHKSRMPFATREAKVHWSGNETIYCVMVLGEEGESEESTVETIGGGVGHHNVSLVLKSAAGHSLKYNVQIFGKK